jgi:hypothetical protein
MRARLVDGWFMRIVGLCVLLAGCYIDGEATELRALAVEHACEDLSCPFAVGADTDILASHEGSIDAIRVEPADLASVAFDPLTKRATVRPTRAGTGTLIMDGWDGPGVLRVPIEAAAVAHTELVPTATYETWDGENRLYPDDARGLYGGTMMRVAAIHRDADGRMLVGHGSEPWTITGGRFRTDEELSSDLESDRYLRDEELLRDVIADSGPECIVGVDGATLPLRVGMLGSAASLALEGYPVDRVIELHDGDEVRPHLIVRDREGRYLHGMPAGTTVEVESDRSVAGASAIFIRRAIFLAAYSPGTTTLTIRFDGAEVTYRVHVE